MLFELLISHGYTWDDDDDEDDVGNENDEDEGTLEVVDVEDVVEGNVGTGGKGVGEARLALAEGEIDWESFSVSPDKVRKEGKKRLLF